MTADADYDPVLFAPSMAAASSVVEGKNIGSARAADLKLSKDLRAATAAHHAQHAAPVAAGRAVGRRKLAAVAARVEAELNHAFARYYGGKTEPSEMRRGVTAVMRAAWRDVFQAGLRAAGVPGAGPGAGKPLVYLGENDTAWLASAVAHEMRFLNGLLDDVVDNDFTMPLATRVGMYARSLTSFYESARVVGLPADVLVHWTGPGDKRTCAGCRYLFAHSPFGKFNLPTVPRAGSTACLTNCRDRLFVRRATAAEVKAVVESHKFTREAHLRNLRRIKATGHP